MVADIAYLQQTQQEIAQLEQLFARQRSAYRAHPMPSAEQRVQWLNSLAELISSERESLIKAISADFSNRSADETILAEIMPMVIETATTNRLLREVLKSTVERMRTPVAATMPNMTRPAPPSTKVGTASTSAPIFGMRPSRIMITPPATQT